MYVIYLHRHFDTADLQRQCIPVYQYMLIEDILRQLPVFHSGLPPMLCNILPYVPALFPTV